MITRHLTSCTITFNPFLRNSRVARIFASLLPPDARQSIKVTTNVLPREVLQPGVIDVVFKDGKQITLKTVGLGIKDVVEELDRHSRMLGRAEELEDK